MTTDTQTAIVPPMSTTGVSLWTPNGPRIVPGHPADDETTTLTVPGRPATVSPDAPGRPATDGHDAPARPGTFDNDVPVRPDDDDQDDPQDIPGHPTTSATDQEDTTTVHEDTPLDGLSKAAAVRRVFDVLGTPTSAQVEDWLAANGIDIDPAYVRRISRAERRRRGLTDTSDLPALTAEVLAELDAKHQIDTRIRVDDVQPDHLETVPYELPPPPADSVPAVAQSTADLEARVLDARVRLTWQDDPALLAALSEEEIQAERDLAEWERETDREIRRAAKAAQLANAQREQATAEHIAKSESHDARWHQRALSARRRLTSPDARLAQLYQRSEWSSRALVAVVLLGMVWSGVNVQHNLVPDGNMGNPLYWLSYGIEAMISVPLIVIMVAATTAARWGRELSRKAVVPIELTLLTFTVGLNAGPHAVGHHPDWAKVAEYAIAPVMVGVVIWLHAWVSQHYAKLVEGSGAIGDQQ